MAKRVVAQLQSVQGNEGVKGCLEAFAQSAFVDNPGCVQVECLGGGGYLMTFNTEGFETADHQKAEEVVFVLKGLLENSHRIFGEPLRLN
ncbi:MAG: hypothetical protein AAB729_03410 [Patescibacteria group bacterium]